MQPWPDAGSGWHHAQEMVRGLAAPLELLLTTWYFRFTAVLLLDSARLILGVAARRLPPQ